MANPAGENRVCRPNCRRCVPDQEGRTRASFSSAPATSQADIHGPPVAISEIQACQLLVPPVGEPSAVIGKVTSSMTHSPNMTKSQCLQDVLNARGTIDAALGPVLRPSKFYLLGRNIKATRGWASAST